MPDSIQDLIKGLSPKRFNPYLAHSQGQKKRALAYYHWNLRLSEALYPLLHLNEVVFRNVMHQALTQEWNTENWFQGIWLHPREQESVQKAANTLRKRKEAHPLEPDRLVAELTFGFWCSLCDSRYEQGQKLWPRLLKQTPLKNIPRRQRQRKEISRAVNRLRQLRNRIFHHEPIWHWKDLHQRHADAVTLLSWLNPQAANLLSQTDRFDIVYQKGPQTLAS